MIRRLLLSLFTDGRRNWRGVFISALFSISFFLIGSFFSSFISRLFFTILVSMSIVSAGGFLIIGRLEGLGYKPMIKIEQWLKRGYTISDVQCDCMDESEK